MEDTKPILSEFLSNYDCKYLVRDITCFKNPENPRCIDLFITNSITSFQNTTRVATGLLDFIDRVIDSNSM